MGQIAVRKKVKDSSVSFWLDINLKSLLPRLKNFKKRPLLNEDNLEKKMNKIYSERKKIYDKSNFKIECDSMKIDEIVNEVIKLYENSENTV